MGCLPVAGVGKYLLVEGTLELYRVSRSSSRWRRRKHQTNAYVSSRQGNKCALGLNLSLAGQGRVAIVRKTGLQEAGHEALCRPNRSSGATVPLIWL